MSPLPARYSKGITFFGHHFFVGIVDAKGAFRYINIGHLVQEDKLEIIRSNSGLLTHPEPKIITKILFGGVDQGGSAGWRPRGGLRSGMWFSPAR